MSVAFVPEGLYQFLNFSLTDVVFGFYLFLVLFFDNLKVAFRKLNADELLDFIYLRLAVFLLKAIFPQGVVKAPRAMPSAALGLGRVS